MLDDLWGLDTYEIEDWVKAKLGKGFEALVLVPLEKNYP